MLEDLEKMDLPKVT